MASNKEIPATGPSEAGPDGVPAPAQPPIDAITKIELFLEKRWRSVVAVLAVFVAIVIVYFYTKYKGEDSMTQSNQALTAAQTTTDLEAVAEQHAGSVAAGSALFSIADKQGANDPTAAGATLNKFVKEYPDHPLYYDALLGLGSIAEKQKDYDKASGYFQQVVEAGDKSSKSALASIFQTELLVAKGELEKAKEAYEAFGLNYTGSPYMDTAIKRLAAVETRIKRAAAPEAPVEPEDPKPEPKPEPKPVKAAPTPGAENAPVEDAPAVKPVEESAPEEAEEGAPEAPAETPAPAAGGDE